MTYTGGEYSTQSIFYELKDLAERENVRSFGEYKELIDALIEEKHSYGFFGDDEDLVQIIKDLESRWPEVEETLAKKSGKPLK